MQSRAHFDPDFHRDASKAVAPLPPSLRNALYFQSEKEANSWWGVKLARLSVDPLVTVYFYHTAIFDRAIDVFIANGMPENGEEWSISTKPSQLSRCIEWNDIQDYDTRQGVCEGRGTHIILRPANTQNAYTLRFYRVVVEAPTILGTRCMKGDTLYVSPDGDDDANRGDSPTSPLRTIQHAVNVARANDTIKLSKGVFRGNSLLPVGMRIPAALADHVVAPVRLKEGYISNLQGHWWSWCSILLFQCGNERNVSAMDQGRLLQ